jgi:hypothetical protein
MKVLLAIRARLMIKAKAVMKVLLAIRARLMTKAKAVMKVPGVTEAKMKIGIMVRVKAGEGTFLTTGRNG